MPSIKIDVQRRFSRAIVLAGLLGLIVGSQSEAAARSQAFMPVGTEIEAPFGYFDFCHRSVGSCPEYDLAVDVAPRAWGAAADRSRKARQRASNRQFWDQVFRIAQAEAESGADPVGIDGERAANHHAGRTVVVMTPALWRRVQRLNRSVNSGILPRSDVQSFGRDDFWAPPPARDARRFGDCEDYVLEKRRLLIAEGVPAEALSIATARLRRNELHAVLLLTTSDGDLVLDNRSAWISPWHALGYRWERRQVAGGRTWARVHA